MGTYVEAWLHEINIDLEEITFRFEVRTSRLVPEHHSTRILGHDVHGNPLPHSLRCSG